MDVGATTCFNLLEPLMILRSSQQPRRSLAGEDAEGFADLCPELNVEEMSADPQVRWQA